MFSSTVKLLFIVYQLEVFHSVPQIQVVGSKLSFFSGLSDCVTEFAYQLHVAWVTYQLA